MRCGLAFQAAIKPTSDLFNVWHDQRRDGPEARTDAVVDWPPGVVIVGPLGCFVPRRSIRPSVRPSVGPSVHGAVCHPTTKAVMEFKATSISRGSANVSCDTCPEEGSGARLGDS